MNGWISFARESALPSVIALIIIIIGSVAYFSIDRQETKEISSQEEFLFEMIMHHEEAISSAKMVLDSDNEEVSNLANNIVSAQEKEVELMESWIAKWHNTSSYSASYMNMMPMMTGLPKDARDKTFLEGMIMHHNGAIKMSEQALMIEGLEVEVKELAENIILDQSKEIAMIQDILKSYN